jgi:hypothetical protein
MDPEFTFMMVFSEENVNIGLVNVLRGLKLNLSMKKKERI